jgi:hypothetical protein
MGLCAFIRSRADSFGGRFTPASGIPAAQQKRLRFSEQTLIRVFVGKGHASRGNAQTSMPACRTSRHVDVVMRAHVPWIPQKKWPRAMRVAS